MTRVALRATWYAVLAAVAAAGVLVGRPDDRDLVVDAFLLFVGALALLVLVLATRSAYPVVRPVRHRRRRRRAAGSRPERLERLEADVLLATETAFDVHYRLRTVLREIAVHRLASRRGVALDADPGRARALLGDELWELVRPDRAPPPERLGRGVSLDEIGAAVAALERM